MKFSRHHQRLFNSNAAVVRDRFPGVYATLMDIGPESAIRVEPVTDAVDGSLYKVITGDHTVCQKSGKPEIGQTVELD